jgi:signal transduction histidine kinase
MDMLRYGLDNEMLQGSSKDVQTIVEDISKYENIVHIRIFDNEDKILYSTDRDEIGRKIEVAAPGHILPSLKKDDIRSIRLLDDNYAAFEPIENSAKCQSCHGDSKVIAYLDVDSHLTTSESYFYTGSLHTIYLGTAIILVLITGFYLFFNRIINQPLRKFMAAITELEKGNMNFRMEAASDNEFGTLEKQFNKMADEINHSREEIEQLHLSQLQHVDKLAHVGELTAEMAHEINNHIGIILSRADYLQLQAYNNNALDKFKDDFDVLADESIKVSKITRNILRHSKKSNKEFKQVDLVNLLDDSMQIYIPLMSKKNIEFKKNIKIESAKIIGDNLQLDQLITNLISNSIDAIDPDGIIEIGIERTNNDKILLYVKDNGKGIPAENIEQIFSPFFSTKESDKGTGIGLYIVKKICDNHNAVIDCESEPGKGTKFNITFN